MRKVLVVAGSAKDFSSAKRYGELLFVSYGSTNLTNLSRHIADFQRILSTLEEAPYILVSGYAVLNALLIMCALEFYKEIEVLIWDAKKKTYSDVLLSKEMLSIENLSLIGLHDDT